MGLLRVNSLAEGKEMHADAYIKGCSQDVFVGSTSISTYGRCRSLFDAQEVFDGLVQRNVVSWTAMMSACAQPREAEMAVQLYQTMRAEGVDLGETVLQL